MKDNKREHMTTEHQGTIVRYWMDNPGVLAEYNGARMVEHLHQMLCVPRWAHARHLKRLADAFGLEWPAYRTFKPRDEHELQVTREEFDALLDRLAALEEAVRA